MIGIVLAGGSGRRFWPLSRRETPKQLLEIWSDRPMIAETVERLESTDTIEDVRIVTGRHLLEDIRSALPHLTEEQFIVEPEARDTLPAIVLASSYIKNASPDEVVGVFPSDHYIGDLEAFDRSLVAAETTATEDYIATLGVEPTRPETGYGYIEFGTSLTPAESETEVFEVENFVEKPDRETAIDYLDAGNYLWNSGIFAFSPLELQREIHRQHPDHTEALERLGGAISKRNPNEIRENFGELPEVSFDYGIMERARNVSVVPAPFQWSDVGHWGALDEVLERDGGENIQRGDVIDIDSEESIVFSTSDRLVATLGLKETVVVDTEDALLVIPKDRAQRVREIVEHLEELERREVL